MDHVQTYRDVFVRRASYAVFFATFLYSIGFIGNFAVPHSYMARPRVGFRYDNEGEITIRDSPSKVVCSFPPSCANVMLA